MSKLRQLTVSAINIALPPPHPPERYAQLWRALYNLKRPVSVHGDIHLWIGSAISLDKKEPDAPLRGTIYRYLEIDKGAQWLDSDTAEFADSKTVASKVVLPPNLKPNSKAFNYLFVPSVHRLFFESEVSESGSLAPSSVEKLIEELSAQPSFAAKFSDVQITLEQDVTEVAKIVEAAGLRELKITIKRPNPDDDSENEEAAIEKELLEQNAREEILILKARSGKGGIKANKRTRALAKVASSNGKVEARIRSEGKTKTVSSLAKPLRKPVTFDPKKIGTTAAFENAALTIADELKK